MNGAESLVRTLIASGVDTCFTNPGTSEMHFVAALDQVPGMRSVLGLFEGVVTGAADGYARMADKPAATLLHCGPGLANGIANLHNANKAGTPVVNIVGDHATWHVAYDAPLTADVEGLAAPVSAWMKTSKSSQNVAADGAEAVAASQRHPGCIASLILPGDTAWEPASAEAAPAALPEFPALDHRQIQQAAERLQSGKRTALMLGGKILREQPLRLAAGIAEATGVTLLAPNSNARMTRGAGIVPIECVPYAVEQALAFLADFEQIVTIGAKPPVAFFAYPDKPSSLLPEGCEVFEAASREHDGVAALQQLADLLGASEVSEVPILDLPPMPVDDPLNPESINAVVAHRMPDQAIVIDEAITAGRSLHKLTAGAAPHDLLHIVGGSIGIGPPLAVGAAVACPDRKVLALQADGSAMYTIQALWTQARENLDVTTIIYANRAYAILQHELNNVGAKTGKIAQDMMRLDMPTLDFVSMARGMGVEAEKVSTPQELDSALQRGLAKKGPYLIEAQY
ncbi:MAG: acetolactate synthase large subunit [Granulosicoccaceae bacterium]